MSDKPKTIEMDRLEPVASTALMSSFRFLTVATVAAFFSCILISIKNNWAQSTSTHCHVPNYLPSISAAIGSYSPQKYIWRIAIAAQFSPRVLYAYIYLQHNLAQPYHTLDHVAYPLVCRLTFFVFMVENVALVLLTYVSSTDWFFIHKLGFSLFVFCSVLHQLLHLFVCRLSVHKCEDPTERRRIRRKLLITCWHLLSLASAMYCYWRHNAFCESGVYTFFALFEYLVVLSNMAFHYMFAFDFEGAVLHVVHTPSTGYVKYSVA